MLIGRQEKIGELTKAGNLTLVTQCLVLVVAIFTVVLLVTFQLYIDAGAIIAVELGDGITSLCIRNARISDLLQFLGDSGNEHFKLSKGHPPLFCVSLNDV